MRIPNAAKVKLGRPDSCNLDEMQRFDLDVGTGMDFFFINTTRSILKREYNGGIQFIFVVPFV